MWGTVNRWASVQWEINAQNARCEAGSLDPELMRAVNVRDRTRWPGIRDADTMESLREMVPGGKKKTRRQKPQGYQRLVEGVVMRSSSETGLGT